MQWIQQRDMKSVLIDNFKEVEELRHVLKDVDNAFFPWNKE